MSKYWVRKIPCEGGLLATTYMAMTSVGNVGVVGILCPIAFLALTQLFRLWTVVFQRLSELS